MKNVKGDAISNPLTVNEARLAVIDILDRIDVSGTTGAYFVRNVWNASMGDAPCPTCDKPGDFSKFHGSAVEKVIWEGYPAPYEGLKPANFDDRKCAP